MDLKQADTPVGTAPRAMAASAPAVAPQPESQCGDRDVRWMVIPLSVLLCVAQAVLTVLAENVGNVVLTSTLISVVAFGVLMVLVLLANPLLGLLSRGLQRTPLPTSPRPRKREQKRWRPLNRAELVCIISAMLVTSGIATYGLATGLVPMVAAPWNPEWNTPQRGWDNTLLPRMNPALYIHIPAAGSTQEQEEALTTLRTFREGVQPRDAADQLVPMPGDSASWAERGRYWWLVAAAIPWAQWIRPLSYWLIFMAAFYAMIYSLAHLVLKFWDKREKLIFPLAKLPEALLPDPANGQWWPPIFRSLGFWSGFSISAAFLSWNGLAGAGLTGSLGRINLGMGPNETQALFYGTFLEGMGEGPYRLVFLIIFTAIGLSFLLPLEISFSVWFYFLLAQFFLLMAIRMGYGAAGTDFPSDVMITQNAISAQASGAILLFSAVSLGRCLLDLYHQSRGQPLAQQLRLGWPALGLGVSLLVVLAWVRWNGIPWVGALLIVSFLVLMTVGLMRLVAEAGMYWIQPHFSPFHIFSTFGLSKLMSPLLLAPLLPIYAVTVMSVRVAMAPNLLNSAKMREDTGGGRMRFHLNMVLCIAVSVVVALGFTVFLAHLRGAQQMSRYNYSVAAPLILDRAQRLASSAPDGGVTINAAWYTAGAGWVGLSMLLRRTLFWLPHPVGYILLVSPLVSYIWFSFFLGWVCKGLVIRYGAKSTFDRISPLFIGLIVGELLTVLGWNIAGLLLNFAPGVSLNRFGA